MFMSMNLYICMPRCVDVRICVCVCLSSSTQQRVFNVYTVAATQRYTFIPHKRCQLKRPETQSPIAYILVLYLCTLH